MPSVKPNGNAVRTQRSRKGLTQEELASKAGCSKKTIERIETGSTSSIGTLEDIAFVLGVSVDVLLDGYAAKTEPEVKRPSIEIIISGRLSDYPQSIQEKLRSLVFELVGNVPCVEVREGSIVVGYDATQEQVGIISAAFLWGAFLPVAAKDVWWCRDGSHYSGERFVSWHKHFDFAAPSYWDEAPFMSLARRFSDDRIGELDIAEFTSDAFHLLLKASTFRRFGSVVRWFQGNIKHRIDEKLHPLKSKQSRRFEAEKEWSESKEELLDTDVLTYRYDTLNMMVRTEFWERLDQLLDEFPFSGRTFQVDGVTTTFEAAIVRDTLRGLSIGQIVERIPPILFRSNTSHKEKMASVIRAYRVACRVIREQLGDYHEEFSKA